MTDLPKPVVAIPLSGAALCLNPDESIFWLEGSNRCPICASDQFVMVEQIIGTLREAERIDLRRTGGRQKEENMNSSESLPQGKEGSK